MLPKQEAKRCDRQQLRRDEQDMQHAVIEHADALDRRVSQRRLDGRDERCKCQDEVDHATPFKRKPTPTSAMMPPAVRTAGAPQLQRVVKPNETPMRWSRPVAITKPAA